MPEHKCLFCNFSTDDLDALLEHENRSHTQLVELLYDEDGSDGDTEEEEDDEET